MLIFTDWPRLDHAHTVADSTRIVLIVSLEFRDPPKHLPIERVNHRTLNLDDYGLIHLIADHTPNPFTPFIF
jgi:hypothetical protein